MHNARLQVNPLNQRLALAQITRDTANAKVATYRNILLALRIFYRSDTTIDCFIKVTFGDASPCARNSRTHFFLKPDLDQ